MANKKQEETLSVGQDLGATEPQDQAQPRNQEQEEGGENENPRLAALDRKRTSGEELTPEEQQEYRELEGREAPKGEDQPAEGNEDPDTQNPEGEEVYQGELEEDLPQE